MLEKVGTSVTLGSVIGGTYYVPRYLSKHLLVEARARARTAHLADLLTRVPAAADHA